MDKPQAGCVLGNLECREGVLHVLILRQKFGMSAAHWEWDSAFCCCLHQSKFMLGSTNTPSLKKNKHKKHTDIQCSARFGMLHLPLQRENSHEKMLVAMTGEYKKRCFHRNAQSAKTCRGRTSALLVTLPTTYLLRRITLMEICWEPWQKKEKYVVFAEMADQQSPVGQNKKTQPIHHACTGTSYTTGVTNLYFGMVRSGVLSTGQQFSEVLVSQENTAGFWQLELS